MNEKALERLVMKLGGLASVSNLSSACDPASLNSYELIEVISFMGSTVEDLRREAQALLDDAQENGAEIVSDVFPSSQAAA